MRMMKFIFVTQTFITNFFFQYQDQIHDHDFTSNFNTRSTTPSKVIVSTDPESTYVPTGG